jgi:hypothetical protein
MEIRIIKTNVIRTSLSREDFYLKYLKSYNYIIVGGGNLYPEYRKLTDRVSFVYGILGQENFIENNNVGRNDQPDQLPEWLEIDLDKEKYLTFSFNEVFVVTEEILDPETGEKEIKEVEKKRMFVFMGKKEINSSAGFGHLTVTEDDGTVVEYIAGLNDILKPADQ